MNTNLILAAHANYSFCLEIVAPELQHFIFLNT